MLTSLSGYKTYLIAIAGLLYAAIGYYLGYLDAAQALQFVQISLTAAGLRSALSSAITTTTSTVVAPTTATITTVTPAIVSGSTPIPPVFIPSSSNQ